MAAKRSAAAAFPGHNDDADRHTIQQEMKRALTDWMRGRSNVEFRPARAQAALRRAQEHKNNDAALDQLARFGTRARDEHHVRVFHSFYVQQTLHDTDSLLDEIAENAVAVARAVGHANFLRDMQVHRGGGVRRGGVSCGDYFVVVFAFDVHDDAVAALARIIRNAVRRAAARSHGEVRLLMAQTRNDVNVADTISRFAGFKARTRRAGCTHHQLRGAHRFTQNGRARVKGVCAACGARVNRFALAH